VVHVGGVKKGIGHLENQDNYCSYVYKAIKLAPSTDGVRVSACCEQTPKKVYSIEDVDNYLTELRKQFDNGQKPESCNRCWISEKSGIDSKRLSGNRYKIFKNTNEIILADFEFSNKCNLACVSCNHIKSSYWGKQNDFANSYHNKTPVGEMNDNNNIALQYYEKHKSTIKRLEVAGGEPTLHDGFIDIYNNSDEDIKINFTTNCTTNFDQLLNERPNTTCILSIDGLNEVYEYTRWPGKWKKVVSRLDNIKDKNSIQEVNSVLQPFNIFNLSKMSHFFNDYEFDFKLIWFVSGKRFLDVVYLPLELLEEAIFEFHQHGIDDNIKYPHYSHLNILLGKRKEWFTIDPKQRELMNNQFFGYVKYLEQNRNASYKCLDKRIVQWIDNGLANTN